MTTANKLLLVPPLLGERGLGGEVPRRRFLQQAALGAVGLLLGSSGLPACAPAASRAHIKGSMRGADFSLGHLLRQPGQLPAPTRTEQVGVLIIGGGVAGLSAKRWLYRHGRTDVLLLELEQGLGGNAAGGQNPVSAYPWGAHYLPVPDARNTELLAFLREAGVITGTDETSGLPVYNEYHLCHDPEERLLIHGHWQQGLVPELGVPAADKAQIQRFFRLVEAMKQAQGADGRDAFCIPLDRSSTDEQFRRLDQLSFADYLAAEGYTSLYLRWYLDYCCQDDYGAPAARVSAWAGLHYFAARKGRAHNAEAADVLTWPEGNAFLVQQLQRGVDRGGIRAATLVYELRETAAGVEALAYDAVTRQTTRILARQVLLATPHFVARRLLAGWADAPALQPYHAPWLIANLTVDGLPQGPGQPLCWDNVRYGSRAVGYIDANHQDLGRDVGQPRVITFYWPLTEAEPDAARRQAYQTSYDQWLQRLLAELETTHPGVTRHVQQAELWVWGHGMVAPTPGYLWGPDEARQRAAQPLRNRVFFAHTDLSGVSIFEEAFYQGIRAATEILAAV
ncbi:FAD-dependent oxidoreductase [Hymenobacter gummosus]|uniref:FAD-dependent oxidoreductase n=1 Tax=Hymenobacter gummosus TaxID=1776032 RepID=A0A431TY04_9BACT|nr:NAD(P)-binding protein [Hymenobacter gummosus]RTQ46491.1 FAD-dependent oxidoreductase [Hymenobacter gummosus]